MLARERNILGRSSRRGNSELHDYMALGATIGPASTVARMEGSGRGLARFPVSEDQDG